jgi:hypothetical protein
VLLALVLLLAGVAFGLLRGGSLDNIARVRFRLPWLVFVGLGLQVGAEAAAARFPGVQRGLTGPLLLGISYAFVVAFVVLNVRFPGTILIGLGLALNLSVILANGAMPVSLWAIRVSGSHAAPRLQNAVKHRAKGPGTHLGFLGDIIPAPPLGIVSVGDVVLGAGVFLLVIYLVAPGHERSEGGVGLHDRPSPPDPPPSADLL